MTGAEAIAVTLDAIYWAGAACVIYPYAVYPALLALRARLRPRPARTGNATHRPSVSIVLAVYNEEEAIARRVCEFTRRIADEGLTGEVVVVSDGSTDATASAARAFEGGPVPVTVLELPENVGKAAAISAGCAAAIHRVIVLADVRQTWDDDALVRLLENFDDPEVGAVSGELIIEDADGVMAGVGLYWRYEKALRKMESRVHSTVGVTGAIAAVRRALFRPVPAGTVLDDVYWPLDVAMQGYRVIFDARARAFDRLPEEAGAELRRKVRTLAGNFQLVARMPGALLPWRNPVWFALVSHKLMRLVVPWALIVTAITAAARGGPFYHGLLFLQLALTAIGLLGLVPGVAERSRMASAGGSFLVLNSAAWLAFWVWVTGRTARSWTKTRYRTASRALSVEGAVR